VSVITFRIGGLLPHANVFPPSGELVSYTQVCQSV